MKTEIDMAGVSFVIGEDIITKISVRTIGFAALVALVSKTTKTLTDDGEVSKAVERARFIAQGDFYAGSKKVDLTVDALMQMPIPLARKIRNAFASPDIKPGKVVSGEKADGITAPILYELGTPIKTDKGEITELEFQASVLSDIEDVLYASTTNEQVLALIRKVATPLGTDTTLMAMPEWAVDAITIVDGATIINTVLPRFLE